MTIQTGRILLVDDSPEDVELTLTALERHKLANEVVVAKDGEQALDYLHQHGEYQGRGGGDPVVVLLDIKLPKIDGLEVLHRMRQSDSLRSIPVVMLTSSREEQDVLRSYRGGVNAYVVKPVHFQDFVNAICEIGLFWAVLNNPPPPAQGAE